MLHQIRPLDFQLAPSRGIGTLHFQLVQEFGHLDRRLYIALSHPLSVHRACFAGIEVTVEANAAECVTARRSRRVDHVAFAYGTYEAVVKFSNV